MCILALYFQVIRDCPLLVAANRDEFVHRPSAPPDVLCAAPWVFGGKDLQAGGTWLGINGSGMFAGILNRRSGDKRGKTGKRSRGLLCLDLLKGREPGEAVEILKRERGGLYDPFNLVFANTSEAYVAHNNGEDIECLNLAAGVHVVGNVALYDPPGAKNGRALELFTAALNSMTGVSVTPAQVDPLAAVRRLRGVLSDHGLDKAMDNPREAICVHRGEYGTVSSSVLLHRQGAEAFDYFHAAGPPCRNDYERCPAVAAQGSEVD